MTRWCSSLKASRAVADNVNTPTKLLAEMSGVLRQLRGLGFIALAASPRSIRDRNFKSFVYSLPPSR